MRIIGDDDARAIGILFFLSVSKTNSTPGNALPCVWMKLIILWVMSSTTNPLVGDFQFSFSCQYETTSSIRIPFVDEHISSVNS